MSVYIWTNDGPIPIGEGILQENGMETWLENGNYIDFEVPAPVPNYTDITSSLSETSGIAGPSQVTKQTLYTLETDGMYKFSAKLSQNFRTSGVSLEVYLTNTNDKVYEIYFDEPNTQRTGEVIFNAKAGDVLYVWLNGWSQSTATGSDYKLYQSDVDMSQYLLSFSETQSKLSDAVDILNEYPYLYFKKYMNEGVLTGYQYNCIYGYEVNGQKIGYNTIHNTYLGIEPFKRGVFVEP